MIIIDIKNGIIARIKSKFILLKFKFEKIKFINPNLKLKVLINKFISKRIKNPKMKGNILKLSSKIEFSKFILFSLSSISFLLCCKKYPFSLIIYFNRKIVSIKLLFSDFFLFFKNFFENSQIIILILSQNSTYLAPKKFYYLYLLN